MALFLDLFGYLSVVLHGLTIVAQSLALGGVVFLLLLAIPLSAELGPAGASIRRGTARVAARSAVLLVVCVSATVALEAIVLIDTLDLSWTGALGAGFVIAAIVQIAAAGLIATSLF